MKRLLIVILTLFLMCSSAFGANKYVLVPMGGPNWSSFDPSYIQVADDFWIGLGAAAGRIEFDDQATDEVNILNAIMGINTQAPQSLLDVQGDAGAAGILTLATKELTVVDGDVLGRINFNAPLESDGSDAILAGAAIWAEADATFSATVNNTELVFATATTSVAVERMRIDSAGKVGIGTSTPTSTITGTARFIDISNIGSGLTAGLTMHSQVQGSEFSIHHSLLTYIDVAGASTASNNAMIFRTEETNSQYTPTERMRITSAGNVTINNPTENGNLVAGLIMKNGTAASAAVTDGIQIFSVNDAGSAATLGLYLENAVDTETDETKFSHKLEVVINGSTYYIMLTDS